MNTRGVYTDDYEWRIADSLEDLFAQVEKETGCKVGKDFERDDWSRLDDEAQLAYWTGQGAGQGERVSKTAREWVAERPNGFLCGTET